tara:strand:+ start:371 stop:586 length:216 start_codon:yes stop_codon:yes gene_type:complete
VVEVEEFIHIQAARVLQDQLAERLLLDKVVLQDLVLVKQEPQHQQIQVVVVEDLVEMVVQLLMVVVLVVQV